MVFLLKSSTQINSPMLTPADPQGRASSLGSTGGHRLGRELRGTSRAEEGGGHGRGRKPSQAPRGWDCDVFATAVTLGLSL